jgi:hypothetical protein
VALVGLFFQTKAKIALMELDVSSNEEHEATATLTMNEIEDGSNINDHIVLNPEKLTIKGVVSETPLGLAALAGSAITAVAGAVGAAQTGMGGALATAAIGSIGGLVASAMGPDGPASRKPSDVFEYLNELRNKRVPFEIVTALKLYTDMVLTALSVPRSISTVKTLEFSATFEKCRIVKAETVSLAAGGVPGASGIANLGQQAASAASEATSAGASVLFNLFN